VRSGPSEAPPGVATPAPCTTARRAAAQMRRATRCSAVALGLLIGSPGWTWQPAWATGAAEPGSAPAGIIGTWVRAGGAERLVVLPGGYLRTCFVGSQRGNAAMGAWRRLGPGRYAVEFTHVAAPACSSPPTALHAHPASIQGIAVIGRGELALHVSGEFPPELYRPLDRAGAR
jgi:hypothetical protein